MSNQVSLLKLVRPGRDLRSSAGPRLLKNERQRWVEVGGGGFFLLYLGLARLVSEPASQPEQGLGTPTTGRPGFCTLLPTGTD